MGLRWLALSVAALLAVCAAAAGCPGELESPERFADAGATDGGGAAGGASSSSSSSSSSSTSGVGGGFGGAGGGGGAGG